MLERAYSAFHASLVLLVQKRFNTSKTNRHEKVSLDFHQHVRMLPVDC